MSADVSGLHAPASRLRPRLRLLAHGAFWFFLLKGLAWLLVPALLVVATGAAP